MILHMYVHVHVLHINFAFAEFFGPASVGKEAAADLKEADSDHEIEPEIEPRKRIGSDLSPTLVALN